LKSKAELGKDKIFFEEQGSGTLDTKKEYLFRPWGERYQAVRIGAESNKKLMGEKPGGRFLSRAMETFQEGGTPSE